MTEDQKATLTRLAMILEAGQAENGIDLGRQDEYAEALRALLSASIADTAKPVIDKSMVKRLMVQHGLDKVPESIADTAGAKPVAQVSIREGFIIGGINYGLPEGKHEVFAAPPAPSVADAQKCAQTVLDLRDMLLRLIKHEGMANDEATNKMYQKTTDALFAASRIKEGAPSVADAAGDKPDGWKLVPIEAPLELLQAVAGRGICCGGTPMPELVEKAKDRWAHILSRAPAPPVSSVADAARASDFTHELKTDIDVFAAVLDGRKTYEIRRNDRGFKVGDTLRLRETRYTGQEMRGPEPRPLEYTGREVSRVVSHILDGYGLQPGWVILSFAAGASEGQASKYHDQEPPAPMYPDQPAELTALRERVAWMEKDAEAVLDDEGLCALANKFALGNPRLDRLRGFVNHIAIILEHAKAQTSTSERAAMKEPKQ